MVYYIYMIPTRLNSIIPLYLNNQVSFYSAPSAFSVKVPERRPANAEASCARAQGILDLEQIFHAVVKSGPFILTFPKRREMTPLPFG